VETQLKLAAGLFIFGACSAPPVPAPAASSQVERGRLLFLASCTACHSFENELGGGPSLHGLPGSRIEVRDLRGELKSLVADDAYLIRAMIIPDYELRGDWPASMPSWGGSPEELQDLLAFIKSHFATH
jgi:mono/diheme cytochrome c family protein